MTLAENFAQRLLAGLGAKPEEIRRGWLGFLRDAEMVREGVLGARQGFSDAINHFNARLDVIERNQRAIMVVLCVSPLENNPALIPLNGVNHGTAEGTGPDSP